MKKLIILSLDGNFNQGFRVSLEVSEEGASPFLSLKNEAIQLPPLPKMPDVYQQWANSYRSLDGYRIKPKKAQITNVSFPKLKQECLDNARLFQEQLTSWLEADEFRPIKEECIRQLASCDEVRMIIRTTDSHIRKLPWHLWDLFQKTNHSYSEVSLSSQGKIIPRQHRNQVRILVILGNSEGIDISNDQALLQQYCGEAEIVFLVEPLRKTFNEYLWDKQGWDLLFFSGHSRTEGTKGRIFINETDSLTLDELCYGLENAINKGLQIAFFNSCDGLGMATELEKLHIPQLVVMREPVPDRVAQQFLKYFLAEFTKGTSFYQAVRVSREKLQGLEGDYPCASWLPVICQDILATPPTWRSLGAIAHCPYQGLSAFQEKDADYFFGRENTLKQLIKAVQEKPMVAIVGPSGSGKSSLVFAGLIPFLKEDTKQNWQFLVFRPGKNPFSALATALSPLLKVNDSILSPEKRLNDLEVEQLLQDNPQELTNRIDENIEPSTQWVLVVDQFEELYTNEIDVKKQQKFLDNLLYAVANAPNFTLILTLRADFYHDVLSYRPFADGLREANFNLSFMDSEELEEAIEKPAALFNIKLETGLKQRIIADNPPLPLLEFALTQLWKKQINETLTHEAYDQMGGVSQALANHANTIYSEFNSEERLLVQQIFIQLVQPTTDKIAIRRIAKRKELGETKWAIVTRLADERLVMTNINRKTQEETVEIIHEALINHWGRLKQWMSLSGEFRRWQEKLRLHLQQWEENKSDNDVLLRGRLLTEAEDWLEQKEADLSQYEKDYIEASLKLQQAQQKEKEKKKKLIIGSLTSGLFCVSFLAVFALFQWKNAAYQQHKADIRLLESKKNHALELLSRGKQFEARKVIDEAIQSLSSSSLKERERKPYRISLALLRSNIREYENPLNAHQVSVNSISYLQDGQIFASGSSDLTIKIWQSNGVLLQTLKDGHEKEIVLVKSSSDGKKLLSVSEDRVNVWTWDDNQNKFASKPSLTLTDTEKFSEVILHPDDQIIISSHQNGKIKFWDTQGNLLKTEQAHDSRIWSLVLHPNGQNFATSSADKTVKIWNKEGEVVKKFDNYDDEVLFIAFSPRGDYLASAMKNNTIQLRNLQNNSTKILKGHTNEVLCVEFSPDGRILASGSNDNTVKLWDTQQGILLDSLEGDSKIAEVRFNPDEESFISADGEGKIRFWKTETLFKKFRGNSISFSSDNQLIAVVNTNGTVTFNDPNGTIYNSFQTGQGAINAIRLTPDKQHIITLGKDNTITKWNLKGEEKKSWQVHEKQLIPTRMKLTPDGQYIVTIGGDNLIKVWDLEGNLQEEWQGDNKKIPAITAMSISLDGKYLATGHSDDIVKIWRLEDKQLKVTLTGHEEDITDIKFSPDGKYIATGSIDNTVKLWLTDGTLIDTEKHQSKVYSLNFSNDSRFLLTGSSGKDLKLWEIQDDLSLFFTMNGMKGYLKDIKFSSDSKFLVLINNHEQVNLLDLEFTETYNQQLTINN